MAHVHPFLARINQGKHAIVGRYKILANGDGFFWNKFARLGQKLKSGDKIAVIGSEGEDVPYGKPYSLAEACDGSDVNT